MRRLLVFVVLVVGCERATAPRPFTLGPGCRLSLPIRDMATVHATYTDCTKMNLDSLQAVGWRVTWDTTWRNQ